MMQSKIASSLRLIQTSTPIRLLSRFTGSVDFDIYAH